MPVAARTPDADSPPTTAAEDSRVDVAAGRSDAFGWALLLRGGEKPGVARNLRAVREKLPRKRLCSSISYPPCTSFRQPIERRLPRKPLTATGRSSARDAFLVGERTKVHAVKRAISESAISENQRDQRISDQRCDQRSGAAMRLIDARTTTAILRLELRAIALGA
jgi:hypothetical protein